MSSKLNKLDLAIDSLKTGELLVQVFDVIRVVGNFMNDDNKRAQGFKLSTLNRLKFLKGNNNRTTFLHHIEKLIRNHFPELCGFIDQLEAITKVTTLDIENLERECQDFGKKIENSILSIDKGNLRKVGEINSSDKVIEVVKPLLEKAEKKIQFFSLI